MSSRPQSNSAEDGRDRSPSVSTPCDQNRCSALDRVIEQTVAGGDEETKDLHALCEAVRRLRLAGKSCDETVVPALVEATLIWRFGHLCADGKICREIAEIIGSDLLEDDWSRARLESLWTKLGESVT